MTLVVLDAVRLTAEELIAVAAVLRRVHGQNALASTAFLDPDEGVGGQPIVGVNEVETADVVLHGENSWTKARHMLLTSSTKFECSAKVAAMIMHAVDAVVVRLLVAEAREHMDFMAAPIESGRQLRDVDPDSTHGDAVQRLPGKQGNLHDHPPGEQHIRATMISSIAAEGQGERRPGGFWESNHTVPVTTTRTVLLSISEAGNRLADRTGRPRAKVLQPVGFTRWAAFGMPMVRRFTPVCNLLKRWVSEMGAADEGEPLPISAYFPRISCSPRSTLRWSGAVGDPHVRTALHGRPQEKRAVRVDATIAGGRNRADPCDKLRRSIA